MRPDQTRQQVALNDSIMVIAFAPIVGLLLGLSSIILPWNTLLLSVVLYIVAPDIVAQLWRRALLAQGVQGATLIGASNFFELAVATAIALFGFQSGAAPATVVGVIVEAPVILSVVHIVRRTRGWYEQSAA